MVEIVAVTFTEKAAGELKLRLREALERATAPTPDDHGCRDAARGRRSTRSKRRTSTRSTASAPSCCASGRSRRDVDPLFAVLTEPQAGSLYCRARSAPGCRRRCGDPPEGLRRALRRTSAPSFGGPEAVSATARSIACAAPAGRSPSARDFPHPWERPPFDRASEIDRLDRGAASISPRSRRRRCHDARQPVRIDTRRRSAALSRSDPSSSSRSAVAISTAGKRGSSI